MNEALVGNAASKNQVASAKEREKKQIDQELDDLRKILTLPEGRRVLWRILKFTRVFESIFEANSKIAYNSGQQDVGHFVMGEIIAARPDALLEMMKAAQENR